jgi:hypothetical protein
MTAREPMLERLEGVAARLEEGTEPVSAGPAPQRLDPEGDWLRQVGSAQRVRIAGAAFTMRASWEGNGATVGAKLRERLEKKAEKALTSSLGEDYEIEEVNVADAEIAIRVSANTSYSRTRSLLSSSRPPWSATVDRAVEVMRRTIRDVMREHHDGSLMVESSWAPGADIVLEGALPGEDSPANVIQSNLSELSDANLRFGLIRWAAIALIAVSIVGSAPLVLLDQAYLTVYTASFALLGLFALPLIVGRIGSNRDQIAQLKERLELRGLLDQEERRAFRLFQLHSADLKRYSDLALAQRRTIFGLGVFCVLLGAGIAIAALALLSAEHGSGEEKILIAAMGAVGAILSNFVALVYLRMFRDTVNSMNVFHTRLVSTHRLLFSNLLAARIADSSERDKTLAMMASSVAHGDSSDGPADSAT